MKVALLPHHRTNIRMMLSVIMIIFGIPATIRLILLLLKKLLFEFINLKKGARKKLRFLKSGESYTTHENTLKECLVDPSQINVDFDSIGGLDTIKTTLKECVVWPFNHPELFQTNGLQCPLGVLLYGPPGTGKTMLAKVLARSTNARFLEIKAESLLCKWVGETEKLVSAVFTLARKVQPTIIFIDELDALLSSRSNSSHSTYTSVKTIFLRHWDGLTTNSLDNRILVIGATNRPQDIDEAILRRMPTKIHLDYPNENDRIAILKTLLKGEINLTENEWTSLSKRTEKYSGSDLKELVKEAKMRCIREVLRDTKESTVNNSPRNIRPLTYLDIIESQKMVKSNHSFTTLCNFPE